MTLEPPDPYDPNVGRVVLWNWRTGKDRASHRHRSADRRTEPDRRSDRCRPALSIRRARSRGVGGHDRRARHRHHRADRFGDRHRHQPGRISLAISSADGTIRLWDPRTGDQQLAPHGHSASVSTILFNPDGSQLASVGGASTSGVGDQRWAPGPTLGPSRRATATNRVRNRSSVLARIVRPPGFEPGTNGFKSRAATAHDCTPRHAAPRKKSLVTTWKPRATSRAGRAGAGQSVEGRSAARWSPRWSPSLRARARERRTARG